MRFLCICAVLVAFAPCAKACPFCSALALSLRAELEQLDCAAIAICTKVADKDAELSIYRFRVINTVKGLTNVQSDVTTSQSASSNSDGPRLLGKTIEAYSFQEYRIGDTALLYGSGKLGDIQWAPSEPLTPLATTYIKRVVALSGDANQNSGKTKSRNTWLNHYFEHLESEDEWVRRDAYNAMATASIKELKPWSQHIGANELKNRIAAEETPTAHRRFYWAVLGLCGEAADAIFAREAILDQLQEGQSQPLARDSIGLDAAISTYLLLGGEDALQEVERELLSSSKRHSSERYAAISALRVHAQEFNLLEKDRICKSLSIALSDPEFADMVIPDLARMQDWSHVSTLMQQYRNQSEKHFIRVPIIRYLRACPLAEAKSALAECKEIDPDAYRRSVTVFPFAGAKPANPVQPASAVSPSKAR